MTSKEYWQKRETEHAKKNKMSEQTYAEEIRKTYAYIADQIQKEIDGFYAKYANAEKISLAEAEPSSINTCLLYTSPSPRDS